MKVQAVVSGGSNQDSHNVAKCVVIEELTVSRDSQCLHLLSDRIHGQGHRIGIINRGHPVEIDSG